MNEAFPSRTGCETWLRYICVLLSTVLVGCGGSDSSSSAAGDGRGTGSVTVLSDATSTLSLPSGAASGHEYVILPYALGGDNISGGNPSAQPVKEVRFTLSASATGNSSFGLAPMQLNEDAVFEQKMESGWTPQLESKRERLAYDHDLRSLWNRFQPKRGLDQERGFWEAAEKLDIAAAEQSTNGELEDWMGFAPRLHHPRILDTFQKIAIRNERSGDVDQQRDFALQTSATSECPELSSLSTVDPSDFPNSGDIPSNLLATIDYVQADTYCLVIAGTLVTESDKAKLASNIATAVELYKSIYGTSGQIPNAGDAKFLPIFFFLDFSDSNVWPQAQAYELMGIYLPEPSFDNNAPTIFMPLDFGAISSSVSFDSTTEANQAFHGTIVHELHHGVLNYYEAYVNNLAEADQTPVAIDEGMAHFFEDVLGYGEAALPLFAATYLDTFHVTQFPVLLSGGGLLSATYRGAAHTFLNYLAAQKGGVSFADGMVSSSSAGLSFLRSFVTGGTGGLGGLAEAYTGSASYDDAWTQALGGYFAAAIADNGDGFGGQTTFQTQAVQTGVTDTNGGTQRTYGMRYNNYTIDSSLSLADVATDWALDESTGIPTAVAAGAASTASISGEQGISYYSTLPIHHVVADGTETFTLTFSETYENMGVAIVRVK